jgi:hypothetical protein
MRLVGVGTETVMVTMTLITRPTRLHVDRNTSQGLRTVTYTYVPYQSFTATISRSGMGTGSGARDKESPLRYRMSLHTPATLHSETPPDSSL